MKIANTEVKKLFSFKEVYVALSLCIGVLTLFFYTNGSDPNFNFWKSMHDFMPRIGFWFIAIMIVVGVSRVIPFEKETGIDELLKTYKKGITKLLLAKIYAVFIYCFIFVTLFYLIAFGVYASIYTIEGYHLPLVNSYNTNLWISVNDLQTEKFTEWQFLLYEYVYMVLASFSFGLFVIIISLLTKISVWVMAICGGIFALFEFYIKFLVFLNFGELFYWLFHYPVHLLYTYGYNGMMGFHYMKMVNLPQYWIITTSLLIPIIIQIGLIIPIHRRKSQW